MEPQNEFEDSAAMKNEWQKRQDAQERKKQDEWHDHTDTDKYLDLEQHGVSFTHESHPTMNSDYLESDNKDLDKWHSYGQNSRNADAFSQDDYILRDNIDLDEDQNESISNEDADR